MFRTEVLCQWVETLDAAIDSRTWSNLADPHADRGPKPCFGVAVAPDRSWAAVAVAWVRPDGATQVMLADYRPDATWVADRVTELRQKWAGRVYVDVASRGLVRNAVELSGPDQAKAHNALSDAALAGTVRHGNEAALNMAVRHATWRTQGDSRVLDRTSDKDISPLVAAALAAHGAKNTPIGGKGRVVVLQ